MTPESPLVHETPTQDEYPGGGNVLRHLQIRRGDVTLPADVVVTGEYEVGMQDQAFLGPESGLAVPAEDGGIDLYIATQWLHVDQRQVAASLGMRSGKGPPAPRRRGRRVRRARGRVDADARLPARAAHRQAGEDGLQPRGVVLRSRAPPSRHDALRARGEPRRQARLRHVRGRARRRRVRLELARRRQQRGELRGRPVRVRQRADRRLRALHEQPAVRRDARVRLGAGLLRARVADGSPRCRARHGPGRLPHPQRDERGLADADRAAHPERRAGGRVAAAGEGRPDAAGLPDRRTRPARPSRWGLEHHARRGRAARRRLRDRVEERRFQRGIRRLLDGARAARTHRRRAGRHGPHRRGRGRPGSDHGAGPDRPHRTGRPPRR